MKFRAVCKKTSLLGTVYLSQCDFRFDLFFSFSFADIFLVLVSF